MKTNTITTSKIKNKNRLKTKFESKTTTETKIDEKFEKATEKENELKFKGKREVEKTNKNKNLKNKKHETFKIATLNVRTLKHNENLLELEKAFDNKKNCDPRLS